MMNERSNSFRGIKDDLSASMVVFLVALPLCLGLGLASTGRPDLVFSGIIAGFIGGLVVGYLSGSPLCVSGPAAGLVVIFHSYISKPDSPGKPGCHSVDGWLQTFKIKSVSNYL